MVSIDQIKPEIISRLKPLNPDKIVLFGSYAYVTPDDNAHTSSDIDLFIFKDDLKLAEIRDYQRKVRKSVRYLIPKYKIGFNILSGLSSEVKERGLFL